MAGIEEKIKGFLRERGVEVMGIAGPERLDGPPSLDPTYTMKGAKSIITFALPMDVDAIYKFLGKESSVPHTLDQTMMNQKVLRISHELSNYINSLGYKAKEVPSNNSYRRSPDAFANHPTFSHRFGAIVSGIAAQGWSGNVMTEEYGASLYLSTVVTDAVLQSDKPRYSPRHFIDNYCSKCKICEKTCVAGMFEPDNEEYILLNGELHPRGKRRNIDFCNASCFGLHSLSRDKKWTTWGTRWIEDWVDDPPSPDKKLKIRQTMFREGVLSGDSTPRYSLIREMFIALQPQDLIESYIADVEETESETERLPKTKEFSKQLGVKNADCLKNERILTCGQCALVCGATLEETTKRYNALINGGFVVPGPNNEVAVVDTYEKALEMRAKYMPEVKKSEMLRDFIASLVMWHQYYGGIEPKSVYQGIVYDRKLKKAVGETMENNKTEVH